MGAAVSVVDFDRDGRPDLYVTDSREGSQNRLYPQSRRRHIRGRRGADGRRRPESRRDRRVDGRGVGRLRQRRLRGPVPLSLGPARAVSQRRRQGLHACDRLRGTAGVGQRQHRGVARLRSRRPPRPLRRRLLPRVDQSVEARRHAHDAGELRVREQRRAQVPASAISAADGSRRSARAPGSMSRRWALAAVAADLRGTGYPDLFIANDYGVSELFANDGGHFREIGTRRRRRLRAEERHERVGRRRAEPGPLRDLRLEHLGRGHPPAGQQPLGADGRCRTACRSTRIWRGRWAWISAAGASARSSPI